MMYRLVYRDGSVGAWSSRKAWVEECAEIFHATVEERKFSKI